MSNGRTLLLTGGAGYIGSHVAQQLAEEAYEVIVLDNLSTGFAAAAAGCELVRGDAGNKKLLAALLDERQIHTVLHFAGSTSVSDSIAQPLLYYRNNTDQSRRLLETCVERGVHQFIFSSTAAVYGIPETSIVTLETPTRPVSPYGWSKLMTEVMLRDLAEVTELRYVTLRYFNVAGADPQGRLGQSTRDATLLVKVVCEAALGKRARVLIHGTDYPTPDGAGVRDYIHVSDLAVAHVLALRHLEAGRDSLTLNCGYGHGHSVREVVRVAEKIHGRPIPVMAAPRRAGDPPRLIADGSSARQFLGWQPRYDDLEYIVKTSYDWEKNPGY